MMRLKTLFRALLDHHDRGISHNTLEDKDMDNENHTTRPDLAFSYLYSLLSKFVQYPGMLHLEAVERVLQYVRATRLTI